MTWNLDPEIFSVGPVTIRWYGLLFASGFLAGTKVLARILKSEGKSEEEAYNLLSYMFFGVLIGARLGHCIFYDPGYYFSHPLEILKIWEGGLASHGAAIGIMIAVWLYVRKTNMGSWLWLADRLSAPIALGGAFVRFGNFFNSEILGKPTDVPWGITFQRIDSIPRHPSQLYEAFLLLAIFFVLRVVYNRKKRSTPEGLLLGLLMTCLFSVRFFLEFLKTQQAAFENPYLLNMGQMLSLPLTAVGLFLLIRVWISRKETSR